MIDLSDTQSPAAWGALNRGINRPLRIAEIGIGLVGFGLFFLFLGVLLLFDNGLLAMGNIFFLSGLALLIGLNNTFAFFFQRHKAKGTSFFLGGICVVLLGWSITGMILEVAGAFFLFSGFFPTIINLLQRVPVVNAVFLVPGVQAVCDRVTGKLPV